MQWGMVARVVPAVELKQQTEAFALRLALWEPKAAAATKRLIMHSAGTKLHIQLEEELKAVVSCMDSESFKLKLRQLRQNRHN